MEFKNKELGLRFTVPDRPTIKQQLDYRGWIFTLREGGIFWRQWKAAGSLIEEWKCEAIPDYEHLYETKETSSEEKDAIFLDTDTNPQITDIIMWVGAEVAMFVVGLEAIPKN